MAHSRYQKVIASYVIEDTNYESCATVHGKMLESSVPLPKLSALTCQCTITVDKANDDLRLLLTARGAEYLHMPGNAGVFELTRTDGSSTDFLLLSFWTSLASFASGTIELFDQAPAVQWHTLYHDGRFPVSGGVSIARLWHGAVPLSKSHAYLELMRSVALEDYARTSGNRAAFVLHRVADELAHFITLTFWESRKAIRAFAGDDIELAKYYDFDRDYLIALEPAVRHYAMLGTA